MANRRTKQKAAHHRGTHQRRAEKVVAAAKRNPLTRCWRCNRTMAEIRRTKPHARWHGGHLVDGQIDGPLKAECSPCNLGAGARLRNARAKKNRPRVDRLNRSRSW